MESQIRNQSLDFSRILPGVDVWDVGIKNRTLVLLPAPLGCCSTMERDATHLLQTFPS